MSTPNKQRQEDPLDDLLRWWAGLTRPLLEDRIGQLVSEEEQLEAQGKTRRLRDVRERIANLESNLRSVAKAEGEQ